MAAAEVEVDVEGGEENCQLNLPRLMLQLHFEMLTLLVRVGVGVQVRTEVS